MVRRHAADAGIEPAIGCHTFRATGITDYLTTGGRIEVAQRMAGHSKAKTGLYDRRNDDVSVGEVERIGEAFLLTRMLLPHFLSLTAQSRPRRMATAIS
jgi:hypothetical protein